MNQIKIYAKKLFDMINSYCIKLIGPKSHNATSNTTATATAATAREGIQIFHFLDGFRGLCAFIVLIVHTFNGKPLDQNTCVHTIMGIAWSYQLAGRIALPGFFVLSSFLLTHHLMKELTESNRSPNEIFKRIAKYFIRRFFRIYLVFVIFCSIIKLTWVPFAYPTSSWIDLVTLRFDLSDPNQLWSIPPEICYYFLIPIICLAFLGFERINMKLKYIVLVLLICFTILNMKYNMLYYFPYLKKLFNKDSQNLRGPLFFCFLNGSLVALVFLFVFKVWTDLFNYIRSSRLIQHSLNIITSFLFIYALRIMPKQFMEHYIIQYSYFWSFTLLILLISSDEYSFVRQCLNNNFMKKWGKYSFGVYLFHPTSFKLYDLIIPNAFFQVNNCYEMTFVICLITYAIAFLFYVLIESNMTKLALYLCNKVVNFT